MRFAVAALTVAALLAGWGAFVDGVEMVPQAALFAGLQAASVAGASLGVCWVWRRFDGGVGRVALVLLALLAWRVAYFPIMVFSGHVASIGEWLAIAAGAPVAVYPVFLICVASLHVVAAVGAGFLLRPPHPVAYAALVPAFAVATLVSFSNAEDLRLLPDRTWRLEARVPAVREARGNPYLTALTAPEYRHHQRVMLFAAGATYETIPESPWARTVKAVLEGLFHENPVASTHDRVVEHYLAYHSAHRLVGCRDLSDCPTAPLLPAAVAAPPPAP